MVIGQTVVSFGSMVTRFEIQDVLILFAHIEHGSGVLQIVFDLLGSKIFDAIYAE